MQLRIAHDAPVERLKDHLNSCLGIELVQTIDSDQRPSSTSVVTISDRWGQELTSYESEIPSATPGIPTFEQEIVGLYFRLGPNLGDEPALLSQFPYTLTILGPLNGVAFDAIIGLGRFVAQRMSKELGTGVRLILDSELEYASYQSGVEVSRDEEGRHKLQRHLLRLGG